VARGRASASGRQLPFIFLASSALLVAGVYALVRTSLLHWDVAGIIGGVCATFSLVSSYGWYRRAREDEDAVAIEEAQAKNRHLPATLHPVVDTDACIGSFGCLNACPEGDVFGVQNGVAVLVNAASCVGHGKCYTACPVSAIKLVFGTAQRGLDLPEVTERFESARPGVHIVGELGGMGLIKNAMSQGVLVAEHIARSIRPGPGADGVVDVAIVGAGPAGIATAVALKAKGYSLRLLDQDALGGTVYHYPRQKVVMSEPVQLPLHGKFGGKSLTKEELLAQFEKVTQKAGVQVEAQTRVSGIEGTDGALTVNTNRGPVSCRKAVLAIGLRGTPKRLGVDGEDLEKVTYRLIDASQYDGSKVLVIGGGDAALEAAIQLAERSDAEVTLSYRQAGFNRAREVNRNKVVEYASSGKLTLLMSSNVRRIEKDAVVIEVQERLSKIANDFVIACIGGELPAEFLRNNGIALKRHYGTSSPDDLPVAAPGSAKAASEHQRRRRLTYALIGIGALITFALAAVGGKYYLLPSTDRLSHPMHSLLRSSGTWGHGIGIASTLLMLVNFTYSLRKRWWLLRDLGQLPTWMSIHQFVGFIGPVAICFHATFQSNNLLATSTAASLGVLVVTGMIGRFAYGVVTDSGGRTVEYAEMQARWERHKRRTEASAAPDLRPIHELLSAATEPVDDTRLFRTLALLPVEGVRVWWRVFRLRNVFAARNQYKEFARAYRRLIQLRTQIGLFRSTKRFLRVWRIWHVALSLFLVFMISAHVGVSVYFGYRWVF